MLCALIQNSLVIGIADLNDDQIQHIATKIEQVIDVSNMTPTPQIGWSFDGQTISGAKTSKKITKLAMRQRFSVTEMINMKAAAATVPIVQYLLDNLTVATYIDLSRTDTINGVYLLASSPLNLITMARANEILNTPARIDEEYHE